MNLSWGNPVTPVTFMQAELENARELLDSFESLALPHTNDLFRMASSLLRNRTEAEDAVQECLLQAWKSFDGLSPAPTVARGSTKSCSMSSHITGGSGADSGSRKIHRALKTVWFADVQEFSYKEIQTTLSIPIGTVMSRLSRGREYLRAKLASMAPPRATRA